MLIVKCAFNTPAVSGNPAGSLAIPRGARNSACHLSFGTKWLENDTGDTSQFVFVMP